MIRPVSAQAPLPAPRPAAAAPPPEAAPTDSVEVRQRPAFRFPGWKVMMFQALTMMSMLAPPQAASAAEALSRTEDRQERVVPKGFRETLDSAREMWEGIADRTSLLHHERDLGEYRLRVDAGTTEIDVVNRTRADVKQPSASLDLGLDFKAEAWRADLNHTERQGDWTFQHGLRSGMSGNYRAARRFHGTPEGTSDEDLTRYAAGVNAEAYAGWSREVAGGAGKVSLDSAAGVGQNLLGGEPTPYLQSSQVLRYDLSGGILGDQADGVVKLREGVSWDARSETLQPSYEAFAGVGKRFEVKGHRVNVEAGVRATGDRHEPFDLAPKVRFGFRW